MRVRAKVAVGLLVFVLLVCGVASFMVYSYQKIDEENKAIEKMMDIQHGVSNLSTCLNEYYAFEDRREVNEWNAQTSMISQSLSSIPVANTPQEALAERLREDLVAAKVMFNSGFPWSQKRGADAMFLNLTLQVQVLANDAAGLSDALHAQVEQNHLSILGLFGLIMLAVGAYFLTTYLVVDRRTLQPLADLYQHIKNSRSNERNLASSVSGEGDVVDLARSFDTMSADLRRETSEKSLLATEIEERKRVESELRMSRKEYQIQSNELAVSNKELEAFSYSIAHDLKAPLRSINGFSHMLFEDYHDKLDENGRRSLEKIMQSSQWMAELINDLLQLSKVTRGEIIVETVNLSDVACEIVHELRQTDPERHVDVQIEKDVVVQGDRNLLVVLLENLLDNAWKYTSKTKNPRIIFGSSVQDHEIVCFVQDNGAGFDEAYAGKLFKPFERLHGVEEYPGTGVGLAIAQRIVTKHGGRIWAEGHVGRGATFHFSLPMSLMKPEKKHTEE